MPNSSVQFEERLGSLKYRIETGKNQKVSGSRVFSVPWGQRVEFAQDLVGKTIVQGTQVVVYPADTLPGYPTVYCSSVDIEGEEPHTIDAPLQKYNVRSAVEPRLSRGAGAGISRHSAQALHPCGVCPELTSGAVALAGFARNLLLVL